MAIFGHMVPEWQYPEINHKLVGLLRTAWRRGGGQVHNFVLFRGGHGSRLCRARHSHCLVWLVVRPRLVLNSTIDFSQL